MALGYHFASDILTGAILGIAIVSAAHFVRVPSTAVRLISRVQDKPAFMLALFLMSFELAVFYQDCTQLFAIMKF